MHLSEVHFFIGKFDISVFQEDPLEQVLKQLVELQELDSKLMHLESLKGDLPHQVSLLRADLDKARSELEDSQNKNVLYKRERGIAEMEDKALEGKQKKYEAQLFQVKTNREYDAVTHEIEGVKEQITTKEGRILELMDLEEETKTTTEQLTETIGKMETKLLEKEKQLKEKLAKTEKDEARLHDQRDKVHRVLTPRMLSTYDRIRKAKTGFVVAPVVKRGCGGCFKSLPPQRIVEIRQMNKIYLCEVCGRILVWDPDKSENDD